MLRDEEWAENEVDILNPSSREDMADIARRQAERYTEEAEAREEADEPWTRSKQ